MTKNDFIKLYDEHASGIYRFAYIKLSSQEDSEDLTSEVFFKFWQSFGHSKEKISNPRALLYRIARNLITDAYRKKSRSEIKTDFCGQEAVKIKDGADLASQIDLDINMAQIRQALNKIKPHYQDIIVWRYLDEFSIKEIAQILNKSESNVRVLVHRAMKSLKEKM